ncbi:LOW QUALITY PROTEIN: hypothetical protein TorRG33x02_274910 [Trema orientale]|uniref:Uncharacterized protein n=1 Tax=Trema orientale TaxID=63057 RepID=A0A2P5CSI5_TREOI|nr:LOW QUALITY PROTEIN: hypothetical protein TorRG33x02_274910 [Trema orientale]
MLSRASVRSFCMPSSSSRAKASAVLFTLSIIACLRAGKLEITKYLSQKEMITEILETTNKVCSILSGGNPNRSVPSKNKNTYTLELLIVKLNEAAKLQAQVSKYYQLVNNLTGLCLQVLTVN